MNGHGPCYSQRQLTELSDHLRHYLSGRFVERIFDVLPVDGLYGNRFAVLVCHCDQPPVSDRFHYAYLSVIESAFRIVPDEHDLGSLLERQHAVCRIAVFRKFAFHFCFEHHRFSWKLSQL